jgi:iron complex outermembrane receptor protein
VSAGQAYRNPTLTESYLSVERQIMTTLPQPLPSQEVPTTFVSLGNTNLKPESITSTELGYHFTKSPHMRASINVFYNHYSDFIQFDKTITYYDTNELFPGSPPGLIPKRVVSTFDNWGKARGFGGEFDIRVRLTNWLTCQTNYAYLEIRDLHDMASTTLIDEQDRTRTEYPRNKVNVGIRVKPYEGWSVNLNGHWVDSFQFHSTDLEENEHLVSLDDYMLLNIRLGYTFYHERAEISLAVFNLFNDRHYEYPPGINLPDQNSTRIGRQITAQIGFGF